MRSKQIKSSLKSRISCADIIARLWDLNLETVIEKDITRLMEMYGRAGAIITKYHPGSPSNPANVFVRASIYDPRKEQIVSTDRLKYPRLEYNTHYQRASTPSNPMFYATRHQSLSSEHSISALRTCLLETIDDYDELVKDKKRVAISLRYNLYDINLYSIFNWDEFQSKNPEIKEVNNGFIEFIANEKPELKDNTRLILDYLADRFKIPVGEKEHEYLPSAVISQYLLPKLIPYGIDGIVFPSTKVLGKEVNVALIPENSDKKLVVTKVLDCEFLPNRIVQVQKRADIQFGKKEVKYNENVQIDIDLK